MMKQQPTRPLVLAAEWPDDESHAYTTGVGFVAERKVGDVADVAWALTAEGTDRLAPGHRPQVGTRDVLDGAAGRTH